MMGWLEDMYDRSFAGSYDNAGRMRGLLRDRDYLSKNGISDENARMYDAALRSQQGQAVAGGVLSGLNGATTLLTNAFQSAQIRDTAMQENQISDLSLAGNYNYQNYDQLANDYARTNFSPQFNYDDIRGMSTGQQVGSVATSALSGAATGLQIGGPWGALIGGVVGLGTGLTGVLSGNEEARNRLKALNLDASLAADASRMNFAAAHERIGDNIHRQNAVNAVAKGGPIRRQSIREYAEKVLGPGARQREYRCGGSIQKVYCDGGLKIKIKR